MDFFMAFVISAIISLALLAGAIVIFASRLKGVYGDVSKPTARSLAWFGVSSVFLGFIPIAGLNPVFSDYTMIFVGIMIACLLISQFHLLFDNQKTVNQSSVIALILAIISALGAVFDVAIFMMISMIIMVPAIIVVSLYLVRVTPSPFTASILMIVISILVAAVLAFLTDLTSTPQFFAFQILPVIISAAVMASMLRPWRRIVTLAVIFFNFTVGASIFFASFLAGDYIVWLFALSVTFASICTIVPLDFFLDQAIVTKAKTPIYISLTLFFVSLLAMTHMNNFTIDFAIGGWDENILFLDWIFGVVGVCTFTLAGISATASDSVLRVSREALIGLGGMLIALGISQVRWVDFTIEMPSIVDFLETSGIPTTLQRWELDPLYIPLMVLIVIGFLGFIRVALHLSRGGSTIAGARFLAFMFASLAIGIVAMFADVIMLLASVEVLATLMIAAGLLLLFSNPRAIFRSETTKSQIK